MIFVTWPKLLLDTDLQPKSSNTDFSKTEKGRHGVEDARRDLPQEEG